MSNVKPDKNNIKSFSHAGLGNLFVVATPIGNLGDITFRAVETLKNADMVACEDTRVTQKLLTQYGIKKKLLTYNDHSDENTREKIIAMVNSGKNVALVSDAGTPLISDPGFKLIREVIKRGGKVVPIPGVSSITTALSAAGLPTDNFYFMGFLPTTQKHALAKLNEVKNLPGSIILFESNNRVVATLKSILNELGNRHCVIGRELTKLYEEFIRGTIEEVISILSQHAAIKGEIVIVIEGQTEKESFSKEQTIALISEELKVNTLKIAVANVTELTGASKKEIYKIALDIQRS